MQKHRRSIARQLDKAETANKRLAEEIQQMRGESPEQANEEHVDPNTDLPFVPSKRMADGLVLKGDNKGNN